jgi:hypothetical protein
MKKASLLGVFLPAFFVVMNCVIAGTENGKPSEGLAKTYYVDFVSGNDANNGTTKESPWKHCSGDPAATDKAKATVFGPGDKIFFKGGVVYRGNMVVQQSGTEGKPITYDGNSQETFGTGRAIVDGSEPLAGWRKCGSADECDGNPNWSNIWWTEVPFPVASPFAANLYEQQNPLDVAQEPKPRCQVWPDPASEYFIFDVKKATSTTIQDEEHLTQTNPHAWDGAIIAVFAQDFPYKQKVTGFDPATHTITFGSFGALPFARRGAAEAPREPGKEGRYALMNALVILNHPGQYVVRSEDKKAKIYLWPLKEGAEPSDVTTTRRQGAFNLNGQSHVTVAGFLIQQFMGGDGAGILDAANKPNGGLVIRNNMVTACNRDLNGSYLKCSVIYLTGHKGSLVEKNQLYENRGAGGIRIALGAGHVIKENAIRRSGGIGVNIWLDAKDCQVIGNTISDNMADNLGAHGPGGILVYHGCSNILILGNQVLNNGGEALALYTPESDITIACNLFQHRGDYVIEGTTCRNLRVFHNVIVNSNPAGRGLWGGGCFDTALKQNNVFVANGGRFDKGAGVKLDEAHNLCADLANMSTIFADPDHQDYTLKKGSPAIGAGVATEIQRDARGTPWPQGKAPDVGAFVYTEK